MALQAPAATHTRRFTVDEVLRMVEVGILHEDEPVELIDGELRVVSPQGWAHSEAVTRLQEELMRVVAPATRVRIQMPSERHPDQLPEPDVQIVPRQGAWMRERRHPRLDETLLVVEVAVSSRFIDLRKAAIYAESGAPVYWLVDVARRCVVVHEEPRSDGSWGRVRGVSEGGAVDVPGTAVTVPVAAILPPPEGNEVGRPPTA